MSKGRGLSPNKGTTRREGPVFSLVPWDPWLVLLLRMGVPGMFYEDRKYNGLLCAGWSLECAVWCWGWGRGRDTSSQDPDY